jgi:Peptidase propeptide and YPEB domain
VILLAAAGVKLTSAARTLLIMSASIAAVVFLGLAASSASTLPPGEGYGFLAVPSNARTYAGGISLDQAIDMVQSRYHAKVVKADVADDGGRRVYVIRVLSPEGRVFSVRVDAETGRMS